jgi:hypothetical protein
MKVYKSYVYDEGCVWPRTIERKDDSVEWRLRYSPNPPSREDVLFAASVMSAYSCLIWTTDKKRRKVIKMLRDVEGAVNDANSDPKF